jgi:hypothetical protein
VRKYAILLLCAGAFGCPSDPPDPTGRLERPSGLAVLDRETVTIEGSPLNREDLLIADSEAEGIKIVQYRGGLGTFVPAPVVFFPLIVSAPGFPTEIAVPVQAEPDHVYVLSTGSSEIHLLDVTPLTFGDSPLMGNQLIRSVDTTAFAPGLIPTDIEIVGTSASGDLLAVAFEGVSTVPDQLMVLAIGTESESVVATATIAALPRRIGVRGLGSADVRVLASSGTSSISEVALDPASGTVTGVRLVDAGGPTQDVLDAGEQGALAIRSDRPAVVHLVPGPLGLVRSDAIDDSPFTPIEERGTPEVRGLLDVHPSPIGAAAVGRVPALVPSPRVSVGAYTGLQQTPIDNEAGRVFRRSQGELPVLLLAHADGLLSYVVVEAETASVAMLTESRVARVSTSTVMSIEVIDPEAGNTVTGTCAATNVCPASESVDPGCPADIVRHEVASFATYRATYRGALAASQTPRFTRVTPEEQRYRISDPSVASYEDRLVQVGDRVLAQVQSQNCLNLESPIDVIATGTVTAVAGAELEVVFEEPFDIVESCDDAEVPELSERYEVYPGDESMVLARVQREEIFEVIARAPVVSNANGSAVEFTERLAVRISSPVPFSCTEGPGRTACANDIDCGVSRECSGGTVATGCAGTCAPTCDGSSIACIAGLVGRSCTRAEFEVYPTIPFVTSAADFSTQEPVPSVAPASAVFSTNRRTFLVSYPGSRVVMELVVSDTGNEIFHIR